MKIVVATGNMGKIKELKRILDMPGVEISSMKEEGYFSEPLETGANFEENALIKARALMSEIKNDADNSKGNSDIVCVVADDSGICVDYMNGAPGIFSARYGGEGASDGDRVEKLLKELSGVPWNERTARFVCAAVAVFRDGHELVTRGEWEGFIAEEPSGENGFGYDPVFYVPSKGTTSASISAEEKNEISHRGKAFRKLAEMIKEYVK